MPLASLANLQWYGPCSSAAYLAGVGSVAAQPRGSIRSASSLSGAGAITYARSLRLIGSPVLLTGSGAITFAQPRGYVRANVTIKVNELSQDDVAGALMQAKIDGEYTFRDVMRIMASVLAGKVSGAETPTVTFRAITDAKDRVVSVTDVDGNRTSVTVDPT